MWESFEPSVGFDNAQGPHVPPVDMDIILDSA